MLDFSAKENDLTALMHAAYTRKPKLIKCLGNIANIGPNSLENHHGKTALWVTLEI